ncbi:MAG: SH3 domain-containing protein [Methyloceanibacter sp.]
MALLEIKPRTAHPDGIARLPKGVANSNARTRADYVAGAIEAPLPLTPERLELIKAYAESRSPHTDGVAASRIAQRFAPRPPAVPSGGEAQPAVQAPLTAPFFAMASGIKRLTAILVVAALLPNLTLAAFWLRAIDMPWSKPAASSKASPTPVHAALPPPVLSAPSALEASAGQHVSFPIALDGTDAIPPSSVIVISGLPQGSRLSSGQRRGATEWTLRPDEIGDLHLVLPAFANAESKLTIRLVAPGDRVVADAAMTLSLIADRDTAEAEADAGGIATEPAEPQISPTAAQQPDAAADDETASIYAVPASPDAAPVSAEAVPLPTRRPEPPKSDDAEANWVTPTAYVNLRDAPSPSAAVLGVMAKGAKLRLVSRKRNWVEVDDPATSKTGWIYLGNAATTR